MRNNCSTKLLDNLPLEVFEHGAALALGRHVRCNVGAVEHLLRFLAGETSTPEKEPTQIQREATQDRHAQAVRSMVRLGSEAEQEERHAEPYMSYSLNSLKGGYTGDNLGQYYSGY